MASRYNIKSKQWTDLPPLNKARSSHCSLVLDDTLLVFGGMGVKSIEALKIGRDAAWSIVQESAGLIGRSYAAVCAINSTEIVVFGGLANRTELNTGYVYNTQTHEVREMILGKESDLAFRCRSQIQWHGKNKYVTLGEDDDGVVHSVQFHMEHATYQEIRSLQDLGHGMLEGEAEQNRLQAKESEGELVQLKKEMRKDALSQEKKEELEQQYRELFEKLKQQLTQRENDDLAFGLAKKKGKILAQHDLFEQFDEDEEEDGWQF